MSEWEASEGSSPHTRGAPGRAPLGRHARGIIPAYAGSTFCGGGHSPRLRDHPRIRGEHCPFPKALLPWTGSSPHTRGAHLEAIVDDMFEGIIPAYAGST